MAMKQHSIAEIKTYLANCPKLDEALRQQLAEDQRAGVRRLLASWERKRAKEKALKLKFQEMNEFERRLLASGYKTIAGIDEAGRGPLAGPVVAGCVVLQPECTILGLNDSKQLSASARDRLFVQIKENALAFGIGMATAQEIDQLNIYQAARQAMLRAVQALTVSPDYLLVDAMTLPVEMEQQSLIKGDARSNSIAAASILAKVTRDRYMIAVDARYPGYEFSAHKGYGTAAHLAALQRLGPCPEHRMTFAPLH